MYKVHLGLFTSQGADVFAPALIYFITRDGKSVLRHVGVNPSKPAMVAAAVAVLCVGWEILQKMDIIPGVFDWYDLLAYALGILGSYLIDRWLTNTPAALHERAGDEVQ